MIIITTATFSKPLVFYCFTDSYQYDFYNEQLQKLTKKTFALKRKVIIIFKKIISFLSLEGKNFVINF